jgi:hypothetical protein
MLIAVAISGDKNMIKKEGEKILKYKDSQQEFSDLKSKSDTSNLYNEPKCTIYQQCIILLFITLPIHVSTLLRHLQGARSQCLLSYISM